MARWIWVFALACGGLEPGADTLRGTPTHSSSIAALRGTDLLVTADEEEGAIVLVDTVRDLRWVHRMEGEPSRVATDGDRIWATLRHAGEVVEFVAGPRGLDEVGRTAVGSEPVGIVVHPDGTRLYVAASMDHRVLELDVDSGETLRTFEMPTEVRWLGVHPGGTLLAAGPVGSVVFSVNLTNENVVRAGTVSGVRRHVLNPGGGVGRRVSGDFDLSPNGQDVVFPTVEIADPIAKIPASEGYYATDAIPGSPAVVTPVLQLARLDLQTGAVVSTKPRSVPFTPSSYASSATWIDDDRVVATLPGAGRVVVVDLGGFGDEEIAVGDGPFAAAVGRDGQVWIHERFDNTIASLDEPWLPVSLGATRLPSALRTGRELFYSTTNATMTSGGISCASCHVDGRSDGRTWTLETGRWQTPSLAGNVDETAPVSWAQEVASVAEEAKLTTEGPMGGRGGANYPALAAYVNQIRLPNPPSVDADPDLLDQGRAAFDKAQCSTCHAPPHFTDNQSWRLYTGQAVQTPTLRGVAATAPYLHDGRAESLEEVLVLAEGVMGSPEALTPQERKSLVAFLKSL